MTTTTTPQVIYQQGGYRVEYRPEGRILNLNAKHYALVSTTRREQGEIIERFARASEAIAAAKLPRCEMCDTTTGLFDTFANTPWRGSLVCRPCHERAEDEARNDPANGTD